MARFFIHRPVFAWVLAIVTMLAGVWSLLGLPISQYPDIAPTTVRITANYSGATARAVQNSVTTPIEDTLTGLEGLLEIAALARYSKLDVRFIEMMPLGHGRAFRPLPSGQLEEAVRTAFPSLAPSEQKRGFGPARYYASSEFRGAVGFIEAVSHNFCGSCNRVRLTSEGFLKLCLCYGEGLDLRALLRGGADDNEIEGALVAAIMGKPARHSFDEGGAGEGRNMSQIGG